MVNNMFHVKKKRQTAGSSEYRNICQKFWDPPLPENKSLMDSTEQVESAGEGVFPPLFVEKNGTQKAIVKNKTGFSYAL